MHIPIVSSLLELDKGPRRFLFFIVFNVVSWQCIVGPALILFGRAIEMPPSWIGFLISFMPLSMLLVLFTVPLVTYLGSKRLMFAAWTSRNLIICAVFVMPWVLTHWGPKQAQFVLLGATLGFCLLRAMGGGGWFPWLHEVVPDKQRGAYFSTETAVTQLLTVGVMAGQAFVLRGEPGIERFLVIYAAGICAGLLSVVWMVRVPGGRGIPGRVSVQASYGSYGVALADRPFLGFVLTASLCFSSISWFSAALVLYMRDVLACSPQTIMTLMAVAGAGILMTIRSWGHFADYAGSGHTMLLTLAGHAACALGCLTLVPGSSWTAYALGPIVVLTGVFAAAFSMAAHRAMLNCVKIPGRVAYTNFWTVGTSLALGLTPILVGIAIDWGQLWGFRLCFSISAAAGVGCALACRRVVRDGQPLQASYRSLINPALPLRTLGRILWITLGLHESGRGRRL